MTNEQIQQKVMEILEANLPQSFYKTCTIRTGYFGGDYLRIFFAASDHDINRVSGQKPQACSLSLDLTTLELQTQIFGGMGGQTIYRKPNQDDRREKYLAMAGVRVPFRKPKAEMPCVLKAIEKFCLNYIKALRENLSVLQYQDIVDYSVLANY